MPGYRGVAYIVFSMLPLAKYGNRIPNIRAEVVAPSAGLTPQLTTTTLYTDAFQPQGGSFSTYDTEGPTVSMDFDAGPADDPIRVMQQDTELSRFSGLGFSNSCSFGRSTRPVYVSRPTTSPGSTTEVSAIYSDGTTKNYLLGDYAGALTNGRFAENAGFFYYTSRSPGEESLLCFNTDGYGPAAVADPVSDGITKPKIS